MEIKKLTVEDVISMVYTLGTKSVDARSRVVNYDLNMLLESFSEKDFATKFDGLEDKLNEFIMANAPTSYNTNNRDHSMYYWEFKEPRHIMLTITMPGPDWDTKYGKLSQSKTMEMARKKYKLPDIFELNYAVVREAKLSLSIFD